MISEVSTSGVQPFAPKGQNILLELGADAAKADRGGRTALRKGTNGVSTNGVAANFIFFDRGTFWVLPLTNCYLPKSARAYLSPQSDKIHYFCIGPNSVDPLCPRAILAVAQHPHLNPPVEQRVLHLGACQPGC